MKPFLMIGNVSEQLDFLPPAMHWINDMEANKQQGYDVIPTNLFYTDIADIAEFNVKIINALHYIGVKKVHELVRLRRRDLQKAEGIGKKARDIIGLFLLQHQLDGFSDLVEYSNQ